MPSCLNEAAEHFNDFANLAEKTVDNAGPEHLALKGPIGAETRIFKRFGYILSTSNFRHLAVVDIL